MQTSVMSMLLSPHRKRALRDVLLSVCLSVRLSSETLIGPAAAETSEMPRMLQVFVLPWKTSPPPWNLCYSDGDLLVKPINVPPTSAVWKLLLIVWRVYGAVWNVWRIATILSTLYFAEWLCGRSPDTILVREITAIVPSLVACCVHVCAKRRVSSRRWDSI